MMRISFATLLGLFLLFGASTAPTYGQLQDVETNRFQVYAGGGLAYPYSTSQFSDLYDPGHTLFGGIGVTLTPEWELSFHGSYSQFDLNGGKFEDVYGELAPSVSGSLAVYSGTMSLKYLIATKRAWTFYFAPGIGIYHRAEEEIKFGVSYVAGGPMPAPATTLAGMHAGFGFSYRFFDALSLYAEPRYTTTASVQNTIEDTVDYASIQIGLIASPF